MFDNFTCFNCQIQQKYLVRIVVTIKLDTSHNSRFTVSWWLHSYSQGGENAPLCSLHLFVRNH